MQKPSSGPGASRPAPGAGGRELTNVDLCVIGGGSGGLSVAAAAAAFGVKVVLIESGKMGGDCLNYGCVPSKALIASAKRAHAMRTAAPFGIAPVVPEVSFAAVRDHIHQVIAAIRPTDSVERFTGLGVHVIQALARFADKRTVVAGDYRIRARRFIVATGSSPLVPPIPGLDTVPYFTNETLFENGERPEHLVVIGGGPIGLEMAQAYRRLGSRVTVLEAMRALGRDDPELAGVVLKALREEGIDLREGTAVERVEASGGGIRVTARSGADTQTVEGTHLLVAAGRRPNIADLNLEAARVRYSTRGIEVSAGLVTSNRRIFAIGDCAEGPQFTHVANYHAGIVIRRALFRLPARIEPGIMPWVTFTDPELAYVGLSEEEARKAYGQIRVLRWPYHENDRAQTERETRGFVKILTDRKGRILGAGVAGAHAGEVIQMWCLALSQKLKIRAMTGWVSPYPTFSEVNKRAAFRYYATAATSPVLRKAISLLAKLG
jgi:pyruvate/2-oxoglutarate dehydrogenase complex dihydrolipoamide dehydrogenase (E3) component